jgi:hypothetical protein
MKFENMSTEKYISYHERIPMKFCNNYDSDVIVRLWKYE